MRRRLLNKLEKIKQIELACLQYQLLQYADHIKLFWFRS